MRRAERMPSAIHELDGLSAEGSTSCTARLENVGRATAARMCLRGGLGRGVGCMGAAVSAVVRRATCAREMQVVSP